MRICYHEINPEPGVPVGLRAALERLLGEAARPDTEIEVRFPRESLGGRGVGSCGFSADYIECLKQVEKDGFDAVVMGCFADPGLNEARRVLHIPVLGPAESAMLCAHLLGATYAVIAYPAPGTRYAMEKHIDEYGFRGKAIVNPVRFMRFPERDLWEIGKGVDSTPMVESFRETAKKAVEDGAEVLIPGCTATSLIHDRISQLDDIPAPVLNPPQCGLKMAEVLVDLKEKVGGHISRVGSFSLRSWGA